MFFEQRCIDSGLGLIIFHKMSPRTHYQNYKSLVDRNYLWAGRLVQSSMSLISNDNDVILFIILFTAALDSYVFNFHGTSHAGITNINIVKGLNPGVISKVGLSMIVRVDIVGLLLLTVTDVSTTSAEVIFRVKVSCITSVDGIILWLLT